MWQVASNPLGNKMQCEHREKNVLFQTQQERFGKTIFLLEILVSAS